MNPKASLFATVILGIGFTLTGCVSDGSFHDKSLQQSQSVDVGNYDVATPEQYEVKMAVLKDKIQKLEKRIATYTQKPYLDPKGWRRRGWRILMGTWQKEVHEHCERIAEHKQELAWQQVSAKHVSNAMESS